MLALTFLLPPPLAGEGRGGVSRNASSDADIERSISDRNKAGTIYHRASPSPRPARCGATRRPIDRAAGDPISLRRASRAAGAPGGPPGDDAVIASPPIGDQPRRRRARPGAGAGRRARAVGWLR